MDAIPRINSWTDSRNLISTVFYGVLLSLSLIIANQHLSLHRAASSHHHQRINSAIKRRIQVQSSTSCAAAAAVKGMKHQTQPHHHNSPAGDKRDVFCASPNNVLHKMSIVRNYLISGRGTNSISAYTNKRTRRKRSANSLYHDTAAVTAASVFGRGVGVQQQQQQTQELLARLNGQTFSSGSRNEKASKIRSLTAYTGELGGGGDTSGSSTPTSTSSTYSSSSCFSSAPVISLTHQAAVLEPQAARRWCDRVPPTCVSTLLALTLLVLPFVPATNLFFYVGFVVAERILYLPSVGFCLCIGIGFDRIRSSSSVSGGSSAGVGARRGKSLDALFLAPLFGSFTRRNKSLNGIAGGVPLEGSSSGSSTISSRVIKVGKSGVGGAAASGKCFIRQSCWRVSQIQSRRRTALMCTVILVLCSFGYRTVRRNFDWHDEESLYKSAIHVNPPKGKKRDGDGDGCR